MPLLWPLAAENLHYSYALPSAASQLPRLSGSYPILPRGFCNAPHYLLICILAPTIFIKMPPNPVLAIDGTVSEPLLIVLAFWSVFQLPSTTTATTRPTTLMLRFLVLPLVKNFPDMSCINRVDKDKKASAPWPAVRNKDRPWSHSSTGRQPVIVFLDAIYTGFKTSVLPKKRDVQEMYFP